MIFLPSTVTKKNATTNILNRRTDWKTDGRTDGRTERRTEAKQYTPLPLPAAGVYLDMCCIVCFTIHPYIMTSRFRLWRDSYFQATNHQWPYLLTLDTRQDMLIDWPLTFNGISFSVMWGSIFSIYQLPVSLLFKIGYTRIGRWKKGDRYQTLFVVLWSFYYLSIDPFGFWNFNDRVKEKNGGNLISIGITIQIVLYFLLHIILIISKINAKNNCHYHDY